MADITFHGNATADAELRHTRGGDPVLNVDVAENHRKRDPQGQWVDDGTTFYRVAIWGVLAEAMAAHIRKGQRLLIAGRFRSGEFTAKDGATVRTYEVTANQVGLIPRRDQQQGGGGYQQAPQQGQPSYSQAQQADGWGQNPNQQADPWNAPQTDEPPF